MFRYLGKGGYRMKIFHTADWHLGKLVQGVYMTDDQAYVLEQFIRDIEAERPDVVIIAGDLYDRAVPPTEAVQLLNQTLDRIVLEMKTPVIAIAGNHDSPSRLHFGSKMMENRGFHIVGQMEREPKPIVLKDDEGEVHFHLVPYSDPSMVAHLYKEESIRSHNEATRVIVEQIKENMDSNARHVYIGHAFVTPYGEAEENTSESERPLSIGGAEYVDARHFKPFHYTALGHLHQAHYVHDETIRYAGSPLKYSNSEANHQKGYLLIEMDQSGDITVDKRLLTPLRDMRNVEGKLEDILDQPVSDDYVFVTLLDETPILSPMEKIRSVFPNAMHIERKQVLLEWTKGREDWKPKKAHSDLELFQGFYREISGVSVSVEKEMIFKDVLENLLRVENETYDSSQKQKENESE